MDPGVVLPATPPQAEPGGASRRAQEKLDSARERLARAERKREVAAGDQARYLQLARRRRARAILLRGRAARAQEQADAAEKQMVDERRNALQEVQARRSAHTMDVLDWLGSRTSAFVVSVLLLVMAFLAACWRPMVGWLALRRAGGLEPATYASALGVTAALLAGGAAAVVPLTDGALSPFAAPVIALGVLLTGLMAWRWSTVTGSPAAAPAVKASGRVVPGTAVVLTLAAGLAIGLLGLLPGEPAERPVTPKTAALARLAQPDPTAHPTKRVARLRRRAEHADRLARRAEAPIAAAENPNAP